MKKQTMDRKAKRIFNLILFFVLILFISHQAFPQRPSYRSGSRESDDPNLPVQRTPFEKSELNLGKISYQPCWSGDGKQIAYLKGEYSRYSSSSWSNKGIEIYDLKTKESKPHPGPTAAVEATLLSVPTIRQKCLCQSADADRTSARTAGI